MPLNRAQLKLLIVGVGMLVVGIILLVVAVMHETVYICGGEPPSPEGLKQYYNKDNNLPVCLTANSYSRELRVADLTRKPALCLAKPITPNDPPVWCQDQHRQVYKHVFLYWSPCEKCGTAWRIHDERINDKSMYKLPAERPGDGDTPSSSSSSSLVPPSSDEWLFWDRTEWKNTTVSFTPCGNNNNDDVDSYSMNIPDEC